MITKKEINAINKSYFNILQSNSFAIYIQSRNTKHYWGILLSKYPTFRNFQILHKHHNHNPYHRHSNAANIEAAINHIKAHDKYHIKRKQAKKKKACRK